MSHDAQVKGSAAVQAAIKDFSARINTNGRSDHFKAAFETMLALRGTELTPQERGLVLGSIHNYKGDPGTEVNNKSAENTGIKTARAKVVEKNTAKEVPANSGVTVQKMDVHDRYNPNKRHKGICLQSLDTHIGAFLEFKKRVAA